MTTQTQTPPHETPTTRLAPSPTGALHLGNARTFLINWAMARGRGWRIRLRIDDLDGPRVKGGADRGAIEDLSWLGMDWDDEPLYQSSDLSPYEQVLHDLRGRALTYPCTCKRSEIQNAQSAPHADEHELRYPGTCRPGPLAADPPADRRIAWRIFVPDEPIEFADEIHGHQTIDVQQQVGDFVVATKAGAPAYQLAVVVDDARQGVTEVVRGDDLLRSTGRQVLLYRLLDLTPLPQYWHVPLVVGSDGRRLAKRHGDTRVAWYRHQGVPAERVVGLLAHWCGIAEQRRPMEAAEFGARFQIEELPRGNVMFTNEDHEWLLANR